MTDSGSRGVSRVNKVILALERVSFLAAMVVASMLLSIALLSPVSLASEAIQYHQELGRLARAVNEAVGLPVVIDSEGSVGAFSSIAVDSRNKVHISYYDESNGNLKYANNTADSWQNCTIDTAGDVGQYTSICVDANDKVHISYHDETSQDLKYATNESGSWQNYTIDNSDIVGEDTSIAVDSHNRIHISYVSYNRWTWTRSLLYANNTAGSWQIRVLDASGDVGYSTSIAIDSNDKVHISYWDYGRNNLRYATDVSGSWEIHTIDKEYGHTSIAVDSHDKIHIGYVSWNGVSTVMKYATDVSGTWLNFTVDDSGDISSQTVSLAVDAVDCVHLVYFDWDDYALEYATNAFGPFQTSIVDKVWCYYASIAVDTDNLVHIGYCDCTNVYLKYTVVLDTPIPEFGVMPFVAMVFLATIVLTAGARRRKEH